MARLLVIRLSALGDVAISVPLVHALAEQYPEHEFLMLSQPRMEGLFGNCPSNVIFISAELYGRHKGLPGLFRLFREIRAQKVDVVCDMHDVIRTRILGFFFNLCRIPVFRINKQRKQRRLLTRSEKKVFKPLMTSFERYQDVFAKAGLSLNYFDFRPKMVPSKDAIEMLESQYGEKKGFWLGFAPFARHAGKIYPLEKSEVVFNHFASDDRFKVFLFGGGPEETAVMKEWQARFPSVEIVKGKSLMDEVRLMSALDVMFAMDSANMHMASLAHTPVVSVWGATHPYAGFYGLFQPETNCIQVDLPCRPCSVFGNKPCHRKDYACLNNINPEVVIGRISGICKI